MGSRFVCISDKFICKTIFRQTELKIKNHQSNFNIIKKLDINFKLNPKIFLK